MANGLRVLVLLLVLPASQQQDCANQYDVTYGAGSCGGYITGNTSLCQSDFSRGAPYAGYCDATCGFGFCPPYTAPSRTCPSLFAATGPISNGSNNRLDAAQGQHRCAALVGMQPDVCNTSFCPTCGAQRNYCDAACGFCISSVVYEVTDDAAIACFAGLATGIADASSRCYADGSLYCNNAGCYESLQALNTTILDTCRGVNYAVDEAFHRIVQDQFPVLNSYCDPCSQSYAGDLGQRVRRCQYLLGCTDPAAYNYDPTRPLDDGSCSFDRCLARLDTCDRATEACNYTSPHNFECACLPGFSLGRVGQHTQAIACMPNGCPAPVAPQFGAIGSCPVGISMASGERCDLSCSGEHTLAGHQPSCSAGNLRNTVSCHSASMQNCTRPTVDDVANMNADTCTDSTLSSATCEYGCERGFVRPASVSQDITCQDGSWLAFDAACEQIELQPVCTVPELGALQADSSHSTDCSLLFTSVHLGLGSALRQGSLCHCVAVIVGHQNVPHCRLHAADLFSPLQAAQECMSECVNPAAVQHGAVVLCSGSGQCHEGQCLCDSGFGGSFCEQRSCANSPLNSLECGSYGVCDRSSGLCSCTAGYIGATCDDAVDCGSTVDSVADSASSCVGNTAFGGSPCQVECRAGYTRGVEVYECGTTGRWGPAAASSTGPLRCPMEIDCAAPNQTAVSSGHVDPSFCGGTTSGQFCDYRCEQGYHLAGGSATLYCYNGDWRGGDPAACVEDDCTAPPQHGNLTNCSTPVQHGTACHVHCAPGTFAVSESAGGSQGLVEDSYTALCQTGTFNSSGVNTAMQCQVETYTWQAVGEFPACTTECGAVEVTHQREVNCISSGRLLLNSQYCGNAVGPTNLGTATCAATAPCTEPPAAGTAPPPAPPPAGQPGTPAPPESTPPPPQESETPPPPSPPSSDDIVASQARAAAGANVAWHAAALFALLILQ